ncbi:TVP38/TMEM64 family protein [Romboutsia ilealis]|uniref:TVP38/TMEM64 family membrane protein n=1 Tax=Romboutsia faecis TaxID=2764597 RepID=A0ABR7JSM6_9FIRM|nr:VTT domain-containing protein [Romboutsia faecis]MBC5997909.1 TVP38/TMEM64 family protein [Romboutsia faecis]MRN25604.1 TVP38/TMEM64 family protein [Romboutsia ilealis]
MEHIQGLFNLAHDYWFLTMIVGLFSTFIESFLPILPLVAIVTVNAAVFGLGMGLVVSWIGSGLGTLALFLIVSKFSDNKFINKYRNGKTQKIVEKVRSKGFKLLFIAYACPFMPACLVTISSALCKSEFKHFATAMLSGKFIMFVVVSYIGSDIRGFITNPIKIIIFSLIVLLAWMIGNKVNSSFDHSEEEFLEINNELK